MGCWLSKFHSFMTKYYDVVKIVSSPKMLTNTGKIFCTYKVVFTIPPGLVSAHSLSWGCGAALRWLRAV